MNVKLLAIVIVVLTLNIVTASSTNKPKSNKGDDSE